MDLITAKRIAEQHVAQCSTETGVRMKLLNEQTIERGFGWVFFYGPEDESTLVAGNAPFIVDRKDGSVHVTGTAHPTEAYLESYAYTGRTYPLPTAEHLVVLEGWKPGMLKISLTKAIRSATRKGLAEAKDCTDSLLAGKAVTLTFATATEADKFCDEAQRLGTLARRETRYH